ncbi:MAG: UDP-N-acetylglucosamine 1-carboxyvinyltransferase [Candidatus Collierbacteria bacterium GW2011_GWD2_45_10]|uniref:UDP-N-acetylglucosamine 1-carboxyvinyltransferase n=1 Tax=Candidatus Collierbacteria bacterium GW2011_GWB2_44_22 TaxID=1618387 RepID=A0A0G1KVC6_9BACT|nr:MAG: UDP-N-acetylglucosamine 1-carboxyvinyltransferase [Candidatus Collierbacteria bacterium GW2011_GWA2_44_13]KKT51859.1 MAG: UDP-N-acetylglucosamine 1-carboxyvinyltransferase [Candidatus Collierbacteria bacterium GW2011_GWB2_44_22]KKT64988.1 MAG: UDP-N-acetylglucosamine 1-carboxyvinyltransferase [Candidatus Collierbacteria bacterium GW2011_GWC2_44_30]KKT88302.1 MAG: UDP-N-acetylglucosamine 1-carboxyvinyltransferase [Candidatus Collierbacteria bacterium GW2011_GWD2_45_10]
MNGVLRITGGRKLEGSVRPIPNKNSLVAVLPASILTNETVVYKNVPGTSDVAKILQILKLLGANVDQSIDGEIKINCVGVKQHKVDQTLGGQFRASLMFAGPLLARFGVAEIPLPGGCDLGMRSISAHLDSFKKAGVKFQYVDGFVKFTAPKKSAKSYGIWQLEASVTATENLFLYAAGTGAEFVITDAACEPHVNELLRMLQTMGAVVEGIGSNKVTIKGSKELKGTTYEPGPDFVDVAGLMVAAAVTDGKIRIKGANVPEIVNGMINWFELFNIKIEREGLDLVVSRNGELVIDMINSGVPLAAPGLPKLYPRPWPGFPVDAIPVMAVLASKTKGRLLLKNWMYESGLEFVRELNAMGADIFVSDPERVIVTGPVKFHGGVIVSPNVIQACKAIFIAALCDPVTTEIHGVDILRRRYPNVFETYTSLGAIIERVDD